MVLTSCLTGEGGLESVHLKEAYLKHPGDDVLGLHRLDVCSARPNVSQENLDRNYTKYLRPVSEFCLYLFAVIKGGKGLSLKINVNPASNCVGNHKEGAGQVVGSGVRMDPSLKVPETNFSKTKQTAANLLPERTPAHTRSP